MRHPLFPFDEVPYQPRYSSRASTHRQGASSCDPFADMILSDGTRFRVLCQYSCIREGEDVRRRFGSAVRFAVDMEVQRCPDEPPKGEALATPLRVCRSSPHPSPIGRAHEVVADPLTFCVVISFDVVRSGALEALGYGTLHERPTTLLLLARREVHRFLLRTHTPTLSSRLGARILWALPLGEEDEHQGEDQ